MCDGECSQCGDASQSSIPPIPHTIPFISFTHSSAGSRNPLSPPPGPRHHPFIQTRAQVELDSVICRSRLPTHSNKFSLPYINRLFLEVLRWRPLLLFGIGRRTEAGDSYNGWRIEKGAWALMNNSAILHDERHFGPDPLAAVLIVK